MVWKGIFQIILVNSKIYESPAKIVNGNREITDKKEIAHTLCEYFSNVGKQFADTIPNVDKSPLDYMAESSSERFCFFPVASQEIVDEIFKLMSGKATGPFSIPVKILKIIKYVISKPLELLF